MATRNAALPRIAAVRLDAPVWKLALDPARLRCAAVGALRDELVVLGWDAKGGRVVADRGTRAPLRIGDEAPCYRDVAYDAGGGRLVGVGRARAVEILDAGDGSLRRTAGLASLTAAEWRGALARRRPPNAAERQLRGELAITRSSAAFVSGRRIVVSDVTAHVAALEAFDVTTGASVWRSDGGELLALRSHPGSSAWLACVDGGGEAHFARARRGLRRSPRRAVTDCGEPVGASWSPDGKLLAVVVKEQGIGVALFELPSGRIRFEWSSLRPFDPIAPGTLPTGVAFAPDASSFLLPTASGSLLEIDARDGSTRRRLAAHRAPILSIAICHRRRLLVTSAADGAVTVHASPFRGAPARPDPRTLDPLLDLDEEEDSPSELQSDDGDVIRIDSNEG